MKRKHSIILALAALFLFAGASWANDLFAVIGGGKHYRRTVVVSPVPGDPLASGRALLKALDTISGQSATNPYLVKIEPGIYELDSNSHLTMKEYVDIEGSGELTTIITRTGASQYQLAHTLSGARNSELRFLTVRNTGDEWTFAIAVLLANVDTRLVHVTADGRNASDTYGVYCISGASPVMKNVTAKAIGGGQNQGMSINGCEVLMDTVSCVAEGSHGNSGIRICNSTVTMLHCTAFATGGTSSRALLGESGTRSTVTLDNCTLVASGGTANYGILSDGTTTVHVTASHIRGSTNSVKLSAATDIGRIGSSLLEGGYVYHLGTCVCAGVCDGNFTFYPDTCPPSP